MKIVSENRFSGKTYFIQLFQGQQPEVATREAEAEWAKLQKMAEER